MEKIYSENVKESCPPILVEVCMFAGEPMDAFIKIDDADMSMSMSIEEAECMRDLLDDAILVAHGFVGKEVKKNG